MTLDGSKSFDPDGQDRIASYIFDFGDGSPAVTQASYTINHLYSRPGTYQISLNVVDSAGTRSAKPALAQLPVDPPAGGSYGLFVVPSNAMGTTPVTVTNAPVSVLAVAEQETLDGTGNVKGFTPYGLIYATTFYGNTNHLYALPLDASKPPAPLQLSSATFSSLCGTFDLLATRGQASSEVLLYTVAGSNGTCGTPADSTFVVHYGDPSSSAPTPSSLNALAVENFDLFRVRNADGTLAGLGSVDGNGNLSFSRDLSYSSPSVLLTHVSAVEPLYYGSGFSFIVVTPTSGAPALYRIDSSGRLSAALGQLHAVPAFSDGVANGGFLYFTDHTATVDQNSASTAYSLSLLKAPLDGSAGAQLVASTSGTYSGGNEPFEVYVDDFIGSTAIVAYDTGSNVGNSFLYALDTSTSGAQLKQILTVQNGGIGFIVPTADGRIFANYLSSPSVGQAGTNTTDVLNPDGSLVTRFSNTDLIGANYVYSGPPSNIQSTVSAVYLAQGTATNGGFSDAGATLQRLAPDSLVTTPVTNAATGRPFVLDNGQSSVELYVNGMPANGAIDNVSSPPRKALGFDAVNNVLYIFPNPSGADQDAVFY